MAYRYCKLQMDLRNDWEQETLHNWWLVRATYVADARFLVTFFGSWRGQCAHTLIHIQIPYTVITMQHGGTILNIGKCEKFGKLQILIKVAGTIGNHIGSLMWQPFELLKKATNQNRKFDVLGIF